MAELEGPGEGTPGQVEAAPTGTTAPAPEPPNGQAQQAQAPDYYDHKQYEQLVAGLRENEATKGLADTVDAFVRSTRSAWTRSQQEIAEQRKANDQKIRAYDAFSQDPATALQQLAAQYGYSLTRGQAVAATGGDPQEWEPQTWGDVRNTIKQEAVREAMETILQKLQPLLGNVQNLQTKAFETQLDGIDPLWRRHEGRMMQLMEKHPTLVGDVATLYEMAIPAAERQARATQEALAKLRTQGENAGMEGQGTKRKTEPSPKKARTFQEAIENARDELRATGRYPG